MKSLVMKSLGVLVLLIGVGILAVPAFTGMKNNMILATGLIVVILGFFLHILLGKKVE